MVIKARHFETAKKIVNRRPETLESETQELFEWMLRVLSLETKNSASRNFDFKIMYSTISKKVVICADSSNGHLHEFETTFREENELIRLLNNAKTGINQLPGLYSCYVDPIGAEIKRLEIVIDR